MDPLDRLFRGFCVGGSCVALASFAFAAEPPPAESQTMAEVAKKLNNPTASLISVPIQANLDFGGGPDDDGFQFKLNIQPVVPIELNTDWKILSRYIVPYVHQENRIGTGRESGLADATATFWISPANEKPGAPIWGVGPVVQVPTATHDLLGTEKWGIGPSVILARQEGGNTMGFLANQIWSVAGDDDRADISVFFVQPFFSHTTPKHTTFGINSESSYDWNSEEWTIPVNVYVTQLVKFGTMPVSLQIGIRTYLDKPAGGPDWGLRFGATLVFPK